MRATLDEIASGLRFFSRLPGHLRHPWTTEEARAVLERRLARREANFLDLLKQAVYGHPGSPYRELLALAGCEYGDAARLVEKEGLEGALHALCRRGVYLTIDELKGRRPAQRGSAAVHVDPVRLRNPTTGFHVLGHSGGSGGASTPIPVDLASIRDRAVDYCLALDARGGSDWFKAVWWMPGRSVTATVRFSSFGAPMARCFLLVDPAAPGLHPRYRWSIRALRLGAVLARCPLPRSEHVPLSDPLPVARWLADTLRGGRVPHVFTFASAAVRLCQAAGAAGVDVRGAQFTVTGEPITAARLAAIAESGARAVADYGSAECGGSISYGCLAPMAADDVHLFHDLHGLIQPGDGVAADLPPQTLLMTSLCATSPLILLNVSMGDEAVVSARRCGCPLDRLGWTTHLHTIRSFEKFTAGGMTFLESRLVPVLEEVLPGRFGGGPTDYQLLEEDGAAGARLRLLVHPAVGPLDEGAVREAFLAAIGDSTGAERVMALHWQDSAMLGVERRPPLTTAGGKFQHVHRRVGAARGDAPGP